MSIIKPMYDNILVDPIEIENKTASGLIVSGMSNSQQYAEGVVVAVGDGYKVNGQSELFPLTVKVGDIVLYRKGVEIQYKDISTAKAYFIISEASVLAIKS